MPETKDFKITGNWVIFRESRHCIHSHQIKKKQGKNHITKRLQSSRAHDIDCTASVHLRLEWRNLVYSHLLEINLKFTHNHIIVSVESLSFRCVKDEVKEKFIELFKDGHLPSSALLAYEDELHLSTTNN